MISEEFAKARKYLSESFRLQDIYKSKVEQLEELRMMCVSINSPMASGEKVSKSSNLHTQENKICNMIQLEEQLKKDIEDIFTTKIDITNKINGIDNQSHKLLLNLRYLNNYTFEKIACEMDISFRWVMKLHKKALKQFEEKYL